MSLARRFNARDWSRQDNRPVATNEIIIQSSLRDGNWFHVIDPGLEESVSKLVSENGAVAMGS